MNRLTPLLLAGGLVAATPQASLDKVADGRSYMVAAPTPEAVQAGLAVLEQGGNAVDAAAATAFALLVTDPVMSSVGGRSQILIRSADGSYTGIDGATQAPLRVDQPWAVGHGYGTVPIPGSPAALEEMLAKFGTLSLGQALQPAIRLAEEGFRVKQDLAEALRASERNLRRYPGTVQHFFKPDGSRYAEGDILKQPTLARTLRTLAEKGSDALYHGELADAFVADMERNGGLVRKDDLAQYRPRPGEIVEGSYRGHRIVARGGNCDGASVIEMLQILEAFDLGSYDITDADYVHILAQTLYLGSADEHVPDWVQVSPAHAARRRLEIDMDKAWPTPVQGSATPGDTHHLSVVDAQGNAVAITQSIGPNFGSKVASPELGFFYAYSYDMNDDPLPFQREKTSQSPTMLEKDGKVFMALGSAGSGRIPGSIVRAVVNVVDHRMALGEALEARRWFIADNQLRIETAGIPPVTLERLGALGYDLRPYEARDPYFASVHAVLVDPATGILHGASDPRDYGAAGGR